MSQVAYDRFVLELPTADATWHPLKDPECLDEAAAWLWDFGPTPLIAVVGTDGAAPNWLASWAARTVNWAPEGATAGHAVVIPERSELERFLAEGAPHEKTVLLWPRTHEAKTFEALMQGGTAWLRTVDAHAEVERNGEIFEVHQVGPA